LLNQRWGREGAFSWRNRVFDVNGMMIEMYFVDAALFFETAWVLFFSLP
jgi:hypothetical protein